jgi:hypothetical protein
VSAIVPSVRPILLLSAVVAAVLVVFFGLVFLVFSLFPPVRFAQLDWVATDTGYKAQQVSEREQEVCVCEAYACGEAEPVHIAMDGWFRRHYAIVKDPVAGDDPSWGRSVVTETTCVLKRDGDPIIFTLTELANDDSTGLRGDTILSLEIE